MFSWTIFSLKQKPGIILRFKKRGVNYEPVGTIGLNAQKTNKYHEIGISEVFTCPCSKALDRSSLFLINILGKRLRQAVIIS